MNPINPFHLAGEPDHIDTNLLDQAIELDTYGGKVHVEWDPDAAVTPLGQLAFFIQFLKTGGRFQPWVDSCPLHYESNNAPKKINVLGSLFLSILSGHKRYAHIGSIINEQVNTQLLGMDKIVSDDSARRALHAIDENTGIKWMQDHLFSCYQPLLKTPWILDADITIKPIYGNQQGAEIGYNPQKPGRPSHTFHTYMIAGLRLILDVDVQPGNQAHSSHSLPGLMALLERFSPDERPECVRGDIGYGTDKIMSSLEAIDQHYLFKLKKSTKVKALMIQQHALGRWTYINKHWEAKETSLQLQGWHKARRVVVVRRQLASEKMIGIESPKSGDPKQGSLAFIDGPEDMKLYEYSVLITDLESDLVSIFHHYRDRADCENNFDEIKNQWGWGGYTTQQLKSSQLISRMIALIYNWWNLFVRLALPGKHHEAITSRPLLLNGVGRLTSHSRQKKLVITSNHGNVGKLKRAYNRIIGILNQIKSIAPQLTPEGCWKQILYCAMSEFRLKTEPIEVDLLPASG